MKNRLLSLITILAVAMTFVLSFAMTDGNAYAAGSKKYYLPKEVRITRYGDNSGTASWTKIKYDKYDNLKSAEYSAAFTEYSDQTPITVKTNYKNSKGKISGVSCSDNVSVIKKTYNDNGRLTKVKIGKDTIKIKSNKKGIISKVTYDGKKYRISYSVKSIKFHKNGVVSEVVYGDGLKGYYNKDGLLTSLVYKDGREKEYKYTKNNGKITKVIVRLDGKKVEKIEYKYSKKSTDDVWKYACTMCCLDGPSDAARLYSKSPLSLFIR